MISVFRNGVQVKGWSSVSVGLSLSTLCDGFSLSQFVGDDFDSPVLFPGDAVRIEEDGELLLDGYVDETSASFSAGSHTINITGREKTCDIVDCSLKDFGLAFKGKTVAQIVESICGGFGIIFRPNGVVSGKSIDKFCPDPGCTGSDMISDVCRQRDVVCTSDGSGHVEFVNKDSFQHSGDLIRQGENVLSADVSFSNTERFSNYVVLSSSDPKTKRKGEASDNEIDRTRYLVLVDESYGNVESATKKASFEAKSRSARSTSVNVTLNGWRMASGKLWKPGYLVDVLIPAFFGNSVQTMLVNSVDLSYDQSGTFVKLELVRSDYYDDLLSKNGKSVKPKKAKADPWKDIRKKTASYEANQ